MWFFRLCRSSNELSTSLLVFRNGNQSYHRVRQHNCCNQQTIQTQTDKVVGSACKIIKRNKEEISETKLDNGKHFEENHDN